jgi:hypothetical protein
MENAFDALSKQLAQVSRRQAIGTFFRGAVGAFLASTWFGSRSAQAQSAACPTCGTCYIQNATTGAMEACEATCGAQTLCNDVQSNGAYSHLAAALTSLYFQPTGYSALISVNGTSETVIFETNYVTSPNSPGVTSTAQLFVVSSPSGKACYAVVFDQNGNPTSGYIPSTSGIQQIAPPPPPPQPFVVSASPSSVTIPQGSNGISIITTTASLGFSAEIGMIISGLPTGVTAKFSPTYIAAPGSGSSTLSITVPASTPTGAYAITVSGKGGGITETVGISLTIEVGSSASVESPGYATGESLPFDSIGFDPVSSSHLATTVSFCYCDPILAAAVNDALPSCASAVQATAEAGCAAAQLEGFPYPLCMATAGLALAPVITLCNAVQAKTAPASALSSTCKTLCVCSPCQYNSGTACVSVCPPCPPGFTCDGGCACVLTTTCPTGTPCTGGPGSGTGLQTFTLCCGGDGTGAGTPLCCTNTSGLSVDTYGSAQVCCEASWSCCQPVQGWIAEVYCCPPGIPCASFGEQIGAGCVSPWTSY